MNEYVIGYQLKIEPPQGGGDDTALNAIELRCAEFGNTTASTYIYSGISKFGTWRGVGFCPDFKPVTGFRLKVEPLRDDGDDAAATNLQVWCGILPSGESLQAGYISDAAWGDWSSWAYCPEGWAVAGITTRIHECDDCDDTGLNGVEMRCRRYE